MKWFTSSKDKGKKKQIFAMLSKHYWTRNMHRFDNEIHSNRNVCCHNNIASKKAVLNHLCIRYSVWAYVSQFSVFNYYLVAAERWMCCVCVCVYNSYFYLLPFVSKRYDVKIVECALMFEEKRAENMKCQLWIKLLCTSSY